ncbi:hypothetical protein CRYUN_Cryun06bG0159900 [Craigia yunnanensis]
MEMKEKGFIDSWDMILIIRISSCITFVATTRWKSGNRVLFYYVSRSIAFYCLSTSASPLVSPNGVGYEVLALMGIKKLLVDPHGVLDNWDETYRDPCSWTMVTRSPDGLVVGLGAPSQDLSGTLAPTIGNLTNIQFVRLTNNNLSGEIPASLANLTQLNLIDLSFNNLSGQVPTFPAKIFNIEGNPYICTNGADKVGCADMDIELLPSSSKAKLNYPSGIYKSGIFYWTLLGDLASAGGIKDIPVCLFWLN